ncbi:MAG: extracellular solute-binding protein [Hyphomonadaceae bacterium]|jgi:ABC-type glycerol-3-phosphate transport system substrate-binding protein|nr:extracellular solute-binding protein [Hyphomonadaceae bacterium]
MTKAQVTRRRFVATTAAASATLIAAPFVRTAGAAGRLSIGFWDHWVPGGNTASKALCEEWGAKNKVEVQVDYITSQGHKNLLTIAAESQARSGHDILAFPTWQPAEHANNLEPVDDLMAELIKLHGKVNPTVEYLARANGRWLAVPACVGSQIKGPCTRIDLLKKHAGIDIQAMYPVGSPPKADGWTLEVMLKAAEDCHKGGNPFGIGLGTPEDNVDTAGAIFQSFGAALVDAKGSITVKSDPVRKALEYYVKLAQWLPPDAPAWDNAANNRYLISGKGTLIMNPPSAWAVAKRDAPQVAEQLWTHGMPSGPAGRYAPFLPYFWGIWSFGKNKTAAKDLLLFLSQRSAVEKMVNASAGYDLPAFEKLTDFRIWAEIGPPPGTLYHYPNPHDHQTLSVAAAPAPPKIAVQIYTQAIHTKMVVRLIKGEPMEKTLAWAESELEGYMRT